jgi:hypothetical protein
LCRKGVITLFITFLITFKKDIKVMEGVEEVVEEVVNVIRGGFECYKQKKVIGVIKKVVNVIDCKCYKML